MEAFEHQYWQGCMAHEVSLLMKDICKLPESDRLHKLCRGLVKWVMNHNVGEGAISSIFRAAVVEHFGHGELIKSYQGDDPRKAKSAYASKKDMGLYTPGDTRMLSTFKMMFRILCLRGPLLAMFANAKYAASAQKAIIAYNTTAKPSKKVKKRSCGGEFVDVYFDTFGSPSGTIWDHFPRFMGSKGHLCAPRWASET